MHETELRRLAAAALVLLDLFVPDEGQRLVVAQQIEDALALPEGRAEMKLLRALARHPALRRWTRQQASWLRERRFLGSALTRYLSVQLPEQVPVGTEFGVHVQITVTAPPGWHAETLEPFDVPADGATLTLSVHAPHLRSLGHLLQKVHIPAAADSTRVLFGFRAESPGLHDIVVSAYRDGSFVGEATVRIAVEQGVATTEGPAKSSRLGPLTGGQGAVTLEIFETFDRRYSWRLIGAGIDPSVETVRVLGDPAGYAARIIEELSRLATEAEQGEPDMRRLQRLRNLGAEVWGQSMPDDVQGEFWRLREENLLRSLTIVSDVDYVPWELTYPVDENHNLGGFLVQQLPVLRRVPKQQPATNLAIHSAAYVVPPGSPSDALHEVEDIRERLGAQVQDWGVVRRRDQLDAVLQNPPSVLHFACHNEFTDTAGSMLWMEDESFDPTDLALAARARSMRDQVPLVFFNACRSAGEIAGLTNPTGWARQFMAAGAGAFIGSLWLVRSEPARNFADAFYTSLVTERRPLGEAALKARRASMTDKGDPTWLAYTVYGHHSARLAAEGNGAATAAG